MITAKREEEMDNGETQETMFLRNFKDAIMHFNMLERNMAYCLRAASEHSGGDGDIARILEFPYDKKLRKIKALISKSGFDAQYEFFLALAEQCRLFRNRLVHGHWEFVEFLKAPIRYHVPTPFEENGKMTLECFAAQVVIFMDANSLFSKLRISNPIEWGAGSDLYNGL